MALTDEVQARYSSQILINVTNPQNTAATSIDTTRLNNAITDVQSEFKKRGITYDNTVDTHIATAVPGVFARLLLFAAQDGSREMWKEFLEDVRFLSETTSRDRIKPDTDSLLDKSADVSGALPAFDKDNFRGYVVNPPSQPSNQPD